MRLLTTTSRRSAPQSVFGLSECGSCSDGFLTVGCIAKGFSPADSLTFKWTDHKGQPVNDFVQYPTIGREGGYTKISHLRVKKSDFTPDKPYKCEAENPVAKKQAFVAPIIKCNPMEVNTLQHGSVQCSEPNGKYSYDSECVYVCNTSYELKGSNKRKCTATKQWTGTPPTCERVKCNPVEVITLHHGKVKCSEPNGMFSYDSECVYSCEEGYKLKGSSTRKCTAAKQWTNTQPTCELVQCSELITPNNGAMKCYDCNGKFSYKSTCEFACNEGYTLRTSSSSTLFCKATGQWNDTQPSCEIIKCKPEDIPRPDHGRVKCSDQKYSYDSVCEYSCEEGYELKGSNMTKCSATTKWTSKPPTCELVKCNPVEVTTLHHGKVQCSEPRGKYSYDSECVYSCETGYELKGSNKRKCTANKQWTGTPPTCELIKCKPEDIPRPDHSSVKCSGPNGNYSYDSVCEYSCEEGYELKEPKTTKCTATTEWTGTPPTCELVKCNPVEVNTLQHGSFQCSEPRGKYSYDSECVYLCNTGYELKGSNKRKCTATKQWTGTPPTCERVKCHPKEVITLHHGKVKCSEPNEMFSYDSVCEYSCEEGYELKGSNTTKCTATKQWTSTPPTCELIKCKPEDIPRPDHSSVKCSGPNGNYSYDSVCEYSCEEGYELKEPKTTKCTAATKWTGKPPTCELVKCNPVEVTTLHHGKVQCSEPRGKYSYDSECVYLCNMGYELKGSNTTKCTATKQWTGTPPTCERVKCHPKEVITLHHGKVKCSEPNEMFSYDSVCEYSCEEGYELKGPNMTKCTATKQWTNTQPTCELVQCPKLTKPNNGEIKCYDCNGNFSYKSTCEFACNEGYTLQTSSSSTLFCEATGQWNDTQPSCEIINCKPEDIPTPDHSSVKCSGPNGNYSYDSVCEYSCEEGYELKGSNITKCTATTEWTGTSPTCELVKCPKEVITLHDGSVNCSGPNGNFSYDAVCVYSCEESYELKGSNTTKCTANKEWSSKPPTCEQPDQPASLYLTTPTNEELKSGTATFTCVAQHFFPEKHLFKWFYGDVEVKSEGKIDECVGKKKTNVTLYTATSILQLKADRWTTPAHKIKCVFEHKAGNETKEKSYTDSSTDSCISAHFIPPSWEDMLKNKSGSLSCRASGEIGFNKMEIQIKESKRVISTSSDENIADNKTVEIGATIGFEEWSNGTEFLCIIEHESSGEPTKIVYVRENDGHPYKRPSVYILAPPEQREGENVTLTCYVKDFYPMEVFVSWLADDEPLLGYTQNTSMPILNDKTYSVYSQLTLDSSKWKNGTVFSCVVYHETIDETLKVLTRSISNNSDKPSIFNLSMNIPAICKG